MPVPVAVPGGVAAGSFPVGALAAGADETRPVEAAAAAGF